MLFRSVGLLWLEIFSPNGPIAEIINQASHHQLALQLSAIIGPYGHLNLPDLAIRRILDLGGPNLSNMFGNPMSDLRDMIQSYPANQSAQVITDLTNLLAQRWVPTFLNVKNVAMLPVLFVILWMYTGMYLILFLANMQKIDTQVIESARIDGANEAQVMRHIILPALSGTLLNSAILAISGSLSSFALVLALTGGGPSRITEILSIYMYNKAFQGGRSFPIANAIALITVAISMALIVMSRAIENRFGGKEE